MQPPFNPKDVFIIKKQVNTGYVNQQRFFRKRTDHNKSEEANNEGIFKEPLLPPIVAKMASQIDNINYKYRNRGLVERKKQNQRKVSLPVLKYPPEENQQQLQAIKRLLDTSPSRVIRLNDFNSMVGYSKISTLMIS